MSEYAVIIAARMNSTRLPGKALARYMPEKGQTQHPGGPPPDGGHGRSAPTTNLAQIVQRWREMSRRQPAVIVATTSNKDDNPIVAECERIGVAYFRGSEWDVLSRVHDALRCFAPAAEFVARALADNPLVDVGLVDWRVDCLRETGADGVWYGADHERITYAGTTDVWRRSAWERIVAESVNDEREHPGLYFWRNLSRFNVVTMSLPLREYLLPIRTELDTARDLEVFRWVFEWWGRERFDDEPLPTIAALDWLGKHPEVTAINSEVPLKTQTRPHWNKGRDWLCKECSERMGAIVAGDLEVRCPGCGRPMKFYAQPIRR